MPADPFAEFERHYPRLVSIDSHGFSRNRLNFFEREREEMRVLTAATEIGPNVWVRSRALFGRLARRKARLT